MKGGILLLGENISKLRKNKNISQEQLAELINVTRQTISNWELNNSAPNPEQLKLLSQNLEVSIDELLDNKITNIILKKVSKNEKINKMGTKILKFLIIGFFIILLIDIISLIVFIFFSLL